MQFDCICCSLPNHYENIPHGQNFMTFSSCSSLPIKIYQKGFSEKNVLRGEMPFLCSTCTTEYLHVKCGCCSRLILHEPGIHPVLVYKDANPDYLVWECESTLCWTYLTSKPEKHTYFCNECSYNNPRHQGFRRNNEPTIVCKHCALLRGETPDTMVCGICLTIKNSDGIKMERVLHEYVNDNRHNCIFTKCFDD